MGLFQSTYKKYERIDYNQWSAPMNQFINDMGFHMSCGIEDANMILYGRMRCPSMAYLNDLPEDFQTIIIDRLLYLGPNTLPGYQTDVGQQAYLTLLMLYHTKTLHMLEQARTAMPYLNWYGLEFLNDDHILVPYQEEKRMSYLLTIDRTVGIDEQNRQFIPISDVKSSTTGCHVSSPSQFQLPEPDSTDASFPANYQIFANP